MNHLFVLASLLSKESLRKTLKPQLSAPDLGQSSKST